MSELKITQLRFKEFNQNLSSTKLKDIILSNTYGPRFNANDYHENGNVKTIRGTDVSLDGNIKYGQVPLAKLDNNFIENHLLEDGDLVMITTADCGLTGIFKKQSIKYIPSAYAVKIRLTNSGYPLYFKYFFQTTLAKNEINKYIRKATVSNLPASDIGRIKINLPSKQEQEKIASFLSSIDTKIEQLTSKTKLLQEYKKGVMQKIFSQEIRFKDDDGSDYPKLVKKKFKDIIQFLRGSSLSKSDLVQNGINKCIHYGELFTIYKEEIATVESTTNLTDGQFSQVGDILMPSSDVTPQGLATASAIFEDKVIIGGDTNILRPIIDLNSLFISYFLNYNQHSIIRLVTGTTVKHIYNKDVATLKIFLPYKEEQTKIANFLSSIDSKIEQIQKQLDSTKEFKKALLQQMFV